MWWIKWNKMELTVASEGPRWWDIERDIKCARKVGRTRKNEKFLCQLDIRHMRNLKINIFSLGLNAANDENGEEKRNFKGHKYK